MAKIKAFIVLAVTFLLSLCGFAGARAEEPLPDSVFTAPYYTGDSLSGDERLLVSLINTYRNRLGLSSLAPSRALSATANRHTLDMSAEKILTQAWTDCDPKSYPALIDERCMVRAPERLGTGFAADAYEILYWKKGRTTPEKVMEEWTKDTLMTNIIANLGAWSGKKWRSIGVGMNKGFVAAWFSESFDTTTESAGAQKTGDDWKQSAPKDFPAALVYYANKLRTDPAGFAGRYLAKGSEAYNEISKQKPIAPLEDNAFLAKLAKSHADEMAGRDALDHDGFEKRHQAAVDSLGNGKTAENCAANSFVDMRDKAGSALSIIVQWAVDDEHPDRGHRKNLLDPELKHAGAGYSVNELSRHVNFNVMLFH